MVRRPLLRTNRGAGGFCAEKKGKSNEHSPKRFVLLVARPAESQCGQFVRAEKTRVVMVMHFSTGRGRYELVIFAQLKKLEKLKLTKFGSENFHLIFKKTTYKNNQKTKGKLKIRKHLSTVNKRRLRVKSSTPQGLATELKASYKAVFERDGKVAKISPTTVHLVDDLLLLAHALPTEHLCLPTFVEAANVCAMLN